MSFFDRMVTNLIHVTISKQYQKENFFRTNFRFFYEINYSGKLY